MGKLIARVYELNIEISDMFIKFFKQENVTKQDLIFLSQKIKKLEEIDKEKYKNLSNKANKIMENSSGFNNTKKLIPLKELHVDFEKTRSLD